MAICYPGSSIWTKPLCDLSFHQAEPLNLWHRTVPVMSCGAKKRSFTVTLTVIVYGSKLLPTVIFKGVGTPWDLAVPYCLSIIHKRGWMDENAKLLSYYFCFFSSKFVMRSSFVIIGSDLSMYVGILLLISGVKEWICTCLCTCLQRNPDNEWSLLVWILLEPTWQSPWQLSCSSISPPWQWPDSSPAAIGQIPQQTNQG